jgi:hypothetical protein
MPGVPLAVRTWLRYVVPLTLLSALAFLPLFYVASRVGAAQDLAKARAQVRLGWLLAGTAVAFQLLLVAGVAPAVRALAGGRPLSQWHALRAGLCNLGRGVIPWLVTIAAIALGGTALVVPGLLLLVLLSLTGASERLGEPPPAPLLDSVAAVRPRMVRVAVIVAAIVVVNLALALALQLWFVPTIAKKVAAVKLLPVRTFVRTLPVVLAAFSPLVACVLAATYARLTRQTS